MTRLCNKIALIGLSLMLSTSGAWALPNCPKDPSAFWSNCVGTYAVQASPSLTGSISDSFPLKVNSCWNIDPESVAASVVVQLGFTLKRDGTLDGDVRLLSTSSGDPSATSEAFERARRAIWRCQRGGYQLPPDKYDQWREVVITFDPRGMRLK